MPQPYVVKPDREFLRSVLDQGGGDLKKCFQCATCSAVCELSDGKRAFPRKEMIWAQWGLKDRLAADPDVWLCHQCNDCSTRCPRGARPGDVLAAIRHQSIQHYAVPTLLARWANGYKYLPIMLLIPVVLLGLALAVRKPLEAIEPLAGVLKLLDHHGFYANLFPHWLLIGFFSFFTGLAFVASVVGIMRFWAAMKAADAASGNEAPASGVVPSIRKVLASILRHDKLDQCQSHASRRWAHLGIFYGFVALFLVSVWAVIALYIINPLIENDLAYPFGLLNPWKLLANVGGLILVAGSVLAIRDRMNVGTEAAESTSFDWIFVWLVLAVGITGLLTEILRFVVDTGTYDSLTAMQVLAYVVYFVHLVCVFDVLVYLPFSKFAHVLYRSTALVYAEHTGRTNGKRDTTKRATSA